MSKTMTTTRQSLLQLTESIQIKDIFTFQINTESLNKNFLIVKECLMKVQQLQNQISKEKMQKDNFSKMFSTLQAKINENQKTILEHDRKIKDLQNNNSDDFIVLLSQLKKKLYELENNAKNTHNFDETVKKLQQMDIFVLKNQFNEQSHQIDHINKQLQEFKSQLNRYATNTAFQHSKRSINQNLAQIRIQIERINQDKSQISQQIHKIENQCETTSKQVEENSKMLKQMNFSELLDKIKKTKQDSDQKIGQFSIKLKKKCGISDLNELEKNLVEKLDKFFAANQKGKASLNETKDAFIYLEKRLNEIYEILGAKQTDQEKDALFSAKQINCASCTKDLGKFQGKLGQFRPWAVFPCKELDPEKAGGLGFLTYVDKMHYKKGTIPDQSSLERLNKTFYEKSRQVSPRKANTARSTNYMNAFGEDTKNSFSLKDEYFKEFKNDKIGGTHVFRVKKDSLKHSTALESVKEKAKQI